MKVIPPITINAAMLTASDAIEDASAILPYNAATGYTLNQTCSIAGANGLITIYRSISGGTNTNHQPPNTTWWSNIGSTYQVYSASKAYALGDYVIDAVAHRTYQSLQASKSNPVTITIAGPCVVAWANHGLTDNTPIYFTTTGALPTGLVANTIYYVVGINASTLNLSAAPFSNGLVTLITTSGTQSGTHTGVVGNLNKTPASNSSYWLDIGPTNKYAMFDLLRDTQTSSGLNGQFYCTIVPGQRVDSIALIGLVADLLQITITSGGTMVYDTGSIDLSSRNVLDWQGFFFNAFTTRESFALFDLPPYLDAEITISLVSLDQLSVVKCGGCAMGQQFYLGQIDFDAESDVLNYSTVDRDFFGNVDAMIQRRNVPTTIQRIWIDKTYVNQARALRDALGGTPAIWSGLDDSADGYFESILICGFYKRFSINLKYPKEALISLELEDI